MSAKLYSLADFAERAGLSYATMRNYHYLGLLPKPSGVVANSPFWIRASVEEWIANHRGPGRPSRQTHRGAKTQ